jgi:hypothetical protein
MRICATQPNTTQIAHDVRLDSPAAIPLLLPPAAAMGRLQLRGLKANAPPAVIFEVSLRCRGNRFKEHLGYINFFNAVEKDAASHTFSFDLPSLTESSCRSSAVYLWIAARGTISKDSHPFVKTIEIATSRQELPE